jgi:hypothetical protein
MPENILYHQKTKGIAGLGGGQGANIGSNNNSINTSLNQNQGGEIFGIQGKKVDYNVQWRSGQIGQRDSSNDVSINRGGGKNSKSISKII